MSKGLSFDFVIDGIEKICLTSDEKRFKSAIVNISNDNFFFLTILIKVLSFKLEVI